MVLELAKRLILENKLDEDILKYLNLESEETVKRGIAEAIRNKERDELIEIIRANQVRKN